MYTSSGPIPSLERTVGSPSRACGSQRVPPGLSHQNPPFAHTWGRGPCQERQVSTSGRETEVTIHTARGTGVNSRSRDDRIETHLSGDLRSLLHVWLKLPVLAEYIEAERVCTRVEIDCRTDFVESRSFLLPI
jgi:hypothetical protein